MTVKPSTPFFPRQAVGEPDLETTFALIKSHAVRGNLVGIILARILRERLVVMMAVQGRLSGEEILNLYGAHAKKPYWPALMESVSGPVVAMVLGGKDVVTAWRTMLGDTDPGYADKGTLRAEFGNVKLIAENVAHGSDSVLTAKREVGLFFPRITLS
jgi:nucleoside-diphosphate kinase